MEVLANVGGIGPNIVETVFVEANEMQQPVGAFGVPEGGMPHSVEGQADREACSASSIAVKICLAVAAE